jgi:hypothetical protein
MIADVNNYFYNHSFLIFANGSFRTMFTTPLSFPVEFHKYTSPVIIWTQQYETKLLKINYAQDICAFT